MPEVEYRTMLRLPAVTVWEFVKDMNNWAPMLTGYQKHEILSETDSIWTLKGDVGVLARQVELKAHVTEWSGPERVSFTLTGLNEPVEGGGTLLLEPAVGEAPPAPAPAGAWKRFVTALFRFLFRLVHGKGPERALPAPGGAAGGAEASRLVFRLRMEAGGVTGPLVNAMLEPMLLPAAEDLANKIAAHLEQAHG